MNRTRSHRTRSYRSKRKGVALNIRINTPAQFNRIFKGPGMKVVIAVSDDTCPHCVNYKSTWKSISQTPGRNVPMVSMPSSVYSQTTLAKENPVNSVPTVVLLDENGAVHEVDGRDIKKMKSIVSEQSIETNVPIEPLPALKIPGLTESVPVSSLYNRSKNNSATSKTTNVSRSTLSILPGVTTEKNQLSPLPGLPVQTGGSPWSAFLMAARQAGPAAVLLGAYSALPKRSSGLSHPRKTRRR